MLMNESDVESNIVAACRAEGKYRLGGGKIVPKGEDPLDEQGGCDCSAFVMWVLGLKKYVPDVYAQLYRFNGGWYNTDGIWYDAVAMIGTGLFTIVEPPAVPCIGDVVVYPAKWVAKKYSGISSGPSIGHIGLVSEMSGSAVTRIAHCSATNFRKFGAAITITPFEDFPKTASRLIVRSANVIHG